MPTQETVLRRSYAVIAFSFFVALLTTSVIPSYSSSVDVFSEETSETQLICYKAKPNMVYYPVEDAFSSVSLDENLVNKVAIDPKEKTERELIDDYVTWICEDYKNVTPELVRSVIMSESSYNPNARNGSHVGLMQVSTKWHKERASRLGVKDLYDPYGGLLVGIDYLDELIESVDGDVAWALMIYNMGHAKAYQFYSKGIVSSYAKEILSRL